MLDTKSLQIISQFKDALNTRNQSSLSTTKALSDKEKSNEAGVILKDLLPSYNRGLKLTNQIPNLDSLSSKVIEYDGKKYNVLTNDLIEKNNLRTKRKWKDFYGDSKKNEPKDEEYEQILDWSDENYSDDETHNNKIHPLKQSKIIELLSPLNHPSELVTHPAISKTYKSEILNKLAMELIDLIEFEQNNLNWLNRLLQVLDGEDWFYLLEENLGLKEYDHGLDENRRKKRKLQESVGDVKDDAKEDVVAEVADITTEAEKSNVGETDNANETEEVKNGEIKADEVNGDKDENKQTEILNGDDTNNEDKGEQAEDLTEKSITLGEYEDEDENNADPFFALPTAIKRYETFQESLESKDESGVKEELINYLQVSIQRQHEYIENLTHLRNGIVRADRLKNDLLKWGKEMHDKKT
ncbi:RXT2 [Candida jiufengensis]|uniref:RXT2 n=1 Tax=Candida jiufengensis TaxID=497108 RepID=UPI0022252BBA|nr:RXT2 [Candida jiufengensis]KAI5949856.1 RXT2 [Candida jiufengensis]